MTPQKLTDNQERGYYIVWDSNRWQKDHVSFETQTFPNSALNMVAARARVEL